MSELFAIAARYERGLIRLILSGELDLETVPLLEEELSQARTAQLDVILDLSGLEFMDGRGVRAIAQTIKDARTKGWHFEIAPTLSPQVRRLFTLMSLPVPLGESG